LEGIVLFTLFVLFCHLFAIVHNYKEGTEVPGELREEAPSLVREIRLEGAPQSAPMDDEYPI
jgi:hypothetical protein